MRKPVIFLASILRFKAAAVTSCSGILNPPPTDIHEDYCAVANKCSGIGCLKRTCQQLTMSLSLKIAEMLWVIELFIALSAPLPAFTQCRLQNLNLSKM